MKSGELLEIIGEAQDAYILDAQIKNRKRVPVWVRWAAIAACFCLVLGAAWNTWPATPGYPDANYSAHDVAALFPRVNSTNTYREVYVPRAEYLPLDSIPEAEYLPIYCYDDSAAQFPDRAQYESFVARVVSNYYNALNLPVQDYVVEESMAATGLQGYKLSPAQDGLPYLQAGQFYLSSAARSTYTRFSINVRPDTIGSQDPTIRLNGYAVQVDQRQSDEQILASLEGVKAQLFAICGVSFSDAKVIRSYDGYSDHGVTYLSVYFYNAVARPIDDDFSRPEFDHIQIRFDNMRNSERDIVSDTILSHASIAYMDYTASAEEFYPQIANAKRISLSEAEALLYKGYVFGGNYCPWCMAAQAQISFEDYDYVSFAYVYGYKEEGRCDVVPFYAFYKAIGTSENGYTIYAKTYVPAIEVSDLDAYFQQPHNH